MEPTNPEPTETPPDSETSSKQDGSEISDNPEFLDLYNDPDLTPDKLNAKLNEYAEAYKQEYELSIANDSSKENVEEVTRDFFKRNSASAAAQIVWLSNNADSETVRLNASKTILAQAFADSRNDGDPIKQLINDLTADPSPKIPGSTGDLLR